MDEKAALSPVGVRLNIGCHKVCDCPPNHLNCLDAKAWLKAQLGVWEFYYEGRDVRDKKLHPATYPIALARRCIELFTHEGELVVDPFAGSGTTLVAARELNRNAVGFDIQQAYVDLCRDRLERGRESGIGYRGSDARPSDTLHPTPYTPTEVQQVAVQDDTRNVPRYLAEESVSLLLTSPPYANLLNRRRKNKSRRGDQRANEQLGKIEQYSQEPYDLGTLPLDAYQTAIEEIYRDLLPLLRPRAHCVINVPDMWWEDKRITLHIAVIEALRSAGYDLRNIIIWDRRNIVNRIGIFGWPNNYITMGVTFEYILDFWRPERGGVGYRA